MCVMLTSRQNGGSVVLDTLARVCQNHYAGDLLLATPGTQTLKPDLLKSGRVFACPVGEHLVKRQHAL